MINQQTYREQLIPVEDNTDGDLMYAVGIYCKKINDITNMLKYLEISTDNKNIKACFELSGYYLEAKNWSEVVKYGKIIYDTGNISYACVLTIAYENLEEYNEMKKYYEIALKDSITKKDNKIDALDGLVRYYSHEDRYDVNKLCEYFKLGSEVYKNGY